MNAGREFHSITAGCILVKIAVFVGQGRQKRESYKQLSKKRSRHTRRETKVRKELADVRGQRKVFLGEVYDFSDTYWRVRYRGGDWEELNRHEVKQGTSATRTGE